MIEEPNDGKLKLASRLIIEKFERNNENLKKSKSIQGIIKQMVWYALRVGRSWEILLSVNLIFGSLHDPVSE